MHRIIKRRCNEIFKVYKFSGILDGEEQFNELVEVKGKMDYKSGVVRNVFGTDISYSCVIYLPGEYSNISRKDLIEIDGEKVTIKYISPRLSLTNKIQLVEVYI